MDRLAAVIPDTAALDAIATTKFFVSLRERAVSASTYHQAYRTIKTFVRWLIAIRALRVNPLDGLAVRTPKTLPAVPTEEELAAVLRACLDSAEGLRNRATILVMSDAGLRRSEGLHLLVEDWHPHERSLFVRSGKGAKDRTVFVGATTARALRAWLSIHPQPTPEAWLFCRRDGRPLTNRGLITVLHRLSARAGLPTERRLHPHALRHLATTMWLRNGVGIDETRRMLGHNSLNTTLRYSSLVSADLQRAHREAGAIDRRAKGVLLAHRDRALRPADQRDSRWGNASVFGAPGVTPTTGCRGVRRRTPRRYGCRAPRWWTNRSISTR